MQVMRTVVWVILLVALVAFSVANWTETSEVHIWENLIWQTRLPAVVIVSFLLGLVPTWLVYRTQAWRLERRIRSLENTSSFSANHDVPVTPAAPPASTSASATQDAGPLTATSDRSTTTP